MFLITTMCHFKTRLIPFLQKEICALYCTSLYTLQNNPVGWSTGEAIMAGLPRISLAIGRKLLDGPNWAGPQGPDRATLGQNLPPRDKHQKMRCKIIEPDHQLMDF